MGYDQVWNIRNRRKWLAAWPRLVADTRTIVDAADIDLTSDRIWDLDEVRREYGGSDAAIRTLLNPPPPIVDEKEGIIINGIQNDGCGPFVLERIPRPMYKNRNELRFSCKTNRRPYDTVVCAVLIRAKQLLGDAFHAGIPEGAHAGEEDDGWERAISLITLLWPENNIPEETWEEWDGDSGPEIDPMELEHPVVELPSKARTERQSVAELQNGDTSDAVQSQLLPLELSDSLLDKIRQWVHHCDTADAGHEICRSTGPQRNLPLMKLIDVQRGCVIPAHSRLAYAALSYVWGNFQQTRLLSSNFKQLCEDDGFRKHSIRIAKTIADSMAMCQRLGYRYLWVDALCILQDNYHDKILQLNSMRDVYSNAAITIVAANGSHANSGLSHAREETSSFEISERSSIWASFTHALSQSVWNTRGWTFQEKGLSRRLLVFSKDGPFFVCGARVYSEHGFQQLDPEVVQVDRPGLFSNIKSGIQLEMYLAAVQDYSKRELTMEADFENAMKGIRKAFGHSMDGRPNGFFQGIPTSCFDEIFCWRVEEHNPNARRRGFSSWSWQGWKQTPIFPSTIMNRIKSKRETNRWGSFILAYDRGSLNDQGRREMTHLDSIGINMPTSPQSPLMVHWRAGPLEVAMESSEDIGSTNGLFRVFSSVNGQDAGIIQLHKEWRAKQRAKMDFLPVFFEKLNGETRIKVLMCLEPSKQERTNGVPLADTLYGDACDRVQLMDCDIGEKDWEAMIEGSPGSKQRFGGFIY